MSRAFKFIIHIGTEKTGTTTLQNLLVHNRELLEDNGIYYLTTPQRIEARGLTAAALGNQQPDEYLTAAGIDTPEKRQLFSETTRKQVHETLSALPAHVNTVVVSSEHFHSRLRHQEQVAWLRELFSGYAESFKVICYLRQQAELVESFYSTALKNGTTWRLEEFAEKLCRNSNHYYNYQMVLRLWGGVFGDDCIVPRLFDAEHLKGGDVVQDFLFVTGFLFELKYPRRQRERYNESLTPLGQQLLRGINSCLADLKNGAGDASGQAFDMDCAEDACKALSSRIIKTFPGSGARLAGKILKHIESEFEASNRCVQQAWFPSLPEELFSLSRRDKTLVEQNTPVTQAQLDVAGEVIDFLSDDTGGPIQSINHCADTLKKLAVHYEKQDVEKSWKLMNLALRIRPRGPFIKNKVDEYKETRRRPFYRLKRWVKR